VPVPVNGNRWQMDAYLGHYSDTTYTPSWIPFHFRQCVIKYLVYRNLPVYGCGFLHGQWTTDHLFTISFKLQYFPTGNSLDKTSRLGIVLQLRHLSPENPNMYFFSLALTASKTYFFVNSKNFNQILIDNLKDLNTSENWTNKWRVTKTKNRINLKSRYIVI